MDEGHQHRPHGPSPAAGQQRVEPGAPKGHGDHGDRGGHDRHAGHSVTMFRDKFWISFALTIPTLVWGHMLPGLIGYQPPPVPGSRWIAPVFGTAVFLYGGWVFIQGALRELKERLPGMMTLIALAISVAFVFSAAVTLGYPGMPLWDELATLVTVMLLGHWIEMRSIFQAQGAVKELAKLLPAPRCARSTVPSRRSHSPSYGRAISSWFVPAPAYLPTGSSGAGAARWTRR